MPWGRQEVWESSKELAVWKSVRQGVGERKEERPAVFDITNYGRKGDHQNDRSPVDSVNPLSDVVGGVGWWGLKPRVVS